MFSGQMTPRATRKQLVGVAEWRLVIIVFDARTDFSIIERHCPQEFLLAFMTPGAFDYPTSYKNKYFPLDLEDVLIVKPTSLL